MDFELDNFNGIILSAETVPNSNAAFASELREVLSYATDNRKNLIWLTLPIEQSHLIGEATAQGFTFHNCEERAITLIHKPKPDTFVPFIPTHTVGAGALIQNDQKEILLIKEHGMKGYKLPGGHVELGNPSVNRWCEKYGKKQGLQQNLSPFWVSPPSTRFSLVSRICTSSAN